MLKIEFDEDLKSFWKDFRLDFLIVILLCILMVLTAFCYYQRRNWEITYMSIQKEDYTKFLENNNEALSKQNAVIRHLFMQLIDHLEKENIIYADQPIQFRRIVEDYDCGNKWHKYLKDLEENNKILRQMIREPRRKPQELIPTAVRSKIGLQNI
jgi:hypothetical protein